MIRLLFVGACVGALMGCAEKDADVTACEASIKTELTAPATYKRVEVLRVDSGPMTIKEFKEKAGIGKPADELSRLKQIMLESGTENHNLSFRELMIKYDAANAYGTPIRSAAICAFRLVDGKLDEAEALNKRATDTGLRAGTELLATIQGKAPPERPKYSCCLL